MKWNTWKFINKTKLPSVHNAPGNVGQEWVGAIKNAVVGDATANKVKNYAGKKSVEIQEETQKNTISNEKINSGTQEK